jgi:hypothetical protein
MYNCPPLQYNYLNQVLPHPDELKKRLLRSAFIGFCAGVASDVTSNSVRVVKTTRQTARRAMSYRDVIQVSRSCGCSFTAVWLACRLVFDYAKTIRYNVLCPNAWC